MQRREFVQKTGILGAGIAMGNLSFGPQKQDFPVVRVSKSKRHFTGQSVDQAIKTFRAKVKNKELAWLFENCFPNTL